MSNDLIAELEEAVRREKLEKAAKEYGPYILAGCLIAILVTGITAGIRNWQAKTNAAHTATLIQSAESPQAARALSETAEQLGAGQELVARLAAAGLYLQNGDKPAALAQFHEAATSKKAPALLRDLALLQATRLAWEVEGPNADAQALLNRLRPLLQKNNPWQAHAQLQSAIIAAHGLHDYEAARQFLAPLLTGTDNLPPSLLMRARALDHVYGLKTGAARPDGQDAATQG